jgi:hypothetical protein
MKAGTGEAEFLFAVQKSRSSKCGVAGSLSRDRDDSCRAAHQASAKFK